MNNSSMSLTNNGLRDWLIQRVAAVIMVVYLLVWLGLLVFKSPFDYAQWHALMTNLPMRIATLMTLLSLILHAWVGIWTVTTDYLKVTWVRLVTQWIVLSGLIICLIWGIVILWGV